MKILLLLTAAAAGIAATSDAQVAKPKADSACTTYPDGRVECRVYRGGFPGDSDRNRLFYRMDSVFANRAALGIQLRSTGTRRDTLGVFVESVTPKGPAENAGIVEGDRIAAVNGVDVRSSAADVDDSYTNGLASHRLTREVQKLSPGARVNLRVYSGGRFRDVQVVAGKASDVMRLSNHFNFRMPGPGGMMEFNGPGPGAMMFRTPMPLMRGKVLSPSRVRIRSGAGARSIAPLREPIRIDKDGAAVIGGDGAEIIRLKNAEPFVLDEPEFEFDGPEWDEFDGADAFDGPDVFEMDSEPFEIEAPAAETIREMGESAVREGQWALKKLADVGMLG
ncbi:MAG TPA: PDZ domain-containing protein [Gemmatimonadaceae bacterium]|nr:PDZ domain-containing protein [Gemmatimonadaceae bacterium]